MAPATSFFLDFLRVAAAFAVFGVHCVIFWAPEHAPAAVRVAHAAVMIFFVLSGYVIAFSTLGRARDARAYTVARLSRLYSVLVPAILLTLVLQAIGHRLNPDFAQFQPRSHEGMRYLAVAGFLQSVWTWSASPQANGPFWSLSYEFWYYAMFGAAVLLPTKRSRILGVVAAALIAGPNILLLLPCWLAGVEIYYLRSRRANGGKSSARLSVFTALLSLGLVYALIPELPRQVGQPPLWYSSAFLSDWLAAASIAIAIRQIDAAQFAAPPKWLEMGVRWTAGHTFSLYLFHFPILAFVTAAWKIEHPAAWQAALAITVTLLAVLALSTFTEAKRDLWKRGFRWLWDAMAVRFRPPVQL